MAKARTVLGVLLLVGVTLSIMACSGTGGRQVLTFFFEGVPPPDGEVPGGEEGGDPVKALSLAEQAALARGGSVGRLYFHEPYIKRDCTSCHNMYNGGAILDPPGGLCASCHQSLLKGSLFIHGPVAVGGCLECHHPHQSEVEHVLRSKSESLCLDCHAKAELFGGEYHSSIGATPQGCVLCHDPHGGDNNLFLKQAGGR